MAAPTRSGAQVLDLIHNSAVGTTVGGWTLTEKTLESEGRRRLWRFVVTGTQNRVFTGYYGEQADGSPGRIYQITDGDGVIYRWSGTAWFRTDGR